jgi:hypothetical protein
LYFAPLVARVDADDRDDLWSHTYTSNGQGISNAGVALLISDATGTPSSYSRFVAGPMSEILAVANVAADSRAELIVRHRDSARVRLVRQE